MHAQLSELSANCQLQKSKSKRIISVMAKLERQPRARRNFSQNGYVDLKTVKALSEEQAFDYLMIESTGISACGI